MKNIIDRLRDKTVRTVLPIIAFSCILMACGSAGREEIDPRGYKLSQPEKFIMPESLLEISGIAFHSSNSDTVYAIQDEQGRLFRLAWGVKKQYNAKFGRSGDYEDLAMLGDRVVVLKSNGTFYSFAYRDAIYAEIDSVVEWKGLLPEGEYEGMYGDEATGKLYVICKNCAGDKSKDNVSGYIIQAGDSAYLAGTFGVDVDQIKAFTGKIKRGFRPSGLARNPVTNDWYIISAVNKLLVVTDGSWRIKEVCPLNGNAFNQPEGIAFDKAGNLYISNEGDDLNEGDILKFARSRQPN